MNTGFQSSNKSSETSSINNQNRLDNIQANSQQNQAVLQSMADQNLISQNIAQQKFNSIKNDPHNDSQQKFYSSTCSTSKKSSNQNNLRDSSVQNEKIDNDKHQNQIILRNKGQINSKQNNNQNQQINKKRKEEKVIENIKKSFYGKRIFIGKGSLSIGEQGKQQVIAFLGLFFPIIMFILYQISYTDGLKSYSVGDSWIICILITSFLCFILFIYCSMSNPGFIPVPYTQKQRHSLPCVQQKGNKEFDLRPLRTHHCKVCDLCVIERDHHCPFLNNCIGYNNRKGYVYFLFVTVLIELFIIAETLFQIIHPFVEDEDFVKSISRSSVILAVIQCIYAAILVANILSLLIFQFQLISRNRTTDEFRRLIAPDPKNIDIQLNEVFDYGCLKNFVNVLVYKRSPEPIYRNFDVLSRNYLNHRYKYYKIKEEKLLHEDEESKGSYKNRKEINHHNDLQPNHTQIPLKMDQYNHQYQIPSIQSNEGQNAYFPKLEQKRNTQSNGVINQNTNSNTLFDKDLSPTTISIPHGYTSMTCSDQNYKNIHQNFSNTTNQNIEKNNQISENQQDKNLSKNINITKQNSCHNLNNQQKANNIQQVTSIKVLENHPSSPKEIQFQLKEQTQQTQENEHEITLGENMKSRQKKQRKNQLTWDDNQLSDTVKYIRDKNIINNQNDIDLQNLSEKEINNENKIKDKQFRQQNSQIICSGLLSNQALDAINSGRPLKLSDKKIYSDDFQEQNQLNLQKKINSEQIKNPSLMDFDKSIIFNDISLQKNHNNNKQNETDNIYFKPKYKNSYRRQKTIDNQQISYINNKNSNSNITNSHQKCTSINQNMENNYNQLNNNNNNVNIFQNSKIISHNNQVQKLEDQIFSSNDIPDLKDDNLVKLQNSSYIEQKSNEFNEIKTADFNLVEQNNFNDIKSFENNDNVASSRRYNGIKNQNSIVNNQFQLGLSAQQTNQYSPYKKKRLFFDNNSNYYQQQQSKQNIASEQSSMTQLQFNKDNDVNKDLSRTATITEITHNNINTTNNFTGEKRNNNKDGDIFDPSLDNTTNLQTAVKDLQIKQIVGAQSNESKYPEIIYDQDDFNYPQASIEISNKLKYKQEESHKRQRLNLLQNQTNTSQILNSNIQMKYNFHQTNSSPKENSNHVNQLI